MTEVRRTNLGGACCFKCAHRQSHGRKCAVNPLYTGGDAGHTCDLFTLDKARWHDLRTQAWEWDEVDTCRIEGELEQCCPYCGSTELIHLDHEEVVE